MVWKVADENAHCICAAIASMCHIRPFTRINHERTETMKMFARRGVKRWNKKTTTPRISVSLPPQKPIQTSRNEKKKIVRKSLRMKQKTNIYLLFLFLLFFSVAHSQRVKRKSFFHSLFSLQRIVRCHRLRLPRNSISKSEKLKALWHAILKLAITLIYRYSRRPLIIF